MTSRWIVRALLPASLVMVGACKQLLVGDMQFGPDEGSTEAAGGSSGSSSSAPGGDASSSSSSSTNGSECESGFTACGSACIQLDNDAENCGSCAHSCLGSACHGGVCDGVEIAAGLDNPQQLTVDDTHVYWTTAGGTVERAPKDGGTVEILATEQESPSAISVDATYVFWINQATGRVQRLAKDGSDKKPKQILMLDGLQNIAQDPHGLYLSHKLKKGELLSVSKDGSGQKTLATGQVEPSYMTLMGNRLVWAGLIGMNDDSNLDGVPDGDEGLGGGYVRSVSVVGGEPSDVATGEGQIVGLAASSTAIVWADVANQLIRKRSVTDPVAVTLAEGQEVRGLAADGDRVLWSTAGGTVKSMLCEGGSPRLLAVDVANVGALTTDASHVYYLRSAPKGAVLRTAK